MDAAARSGDLRKSRAAQRQLHVVDLMHELGVCLRCVKAFIVDLNDLICDALACLAHAGEVKHGGVCLSGVRVGALEVRVVHVAFRLDPADEIDRALVARGRAERKHKELVAEMLAQEHLGLTPEVGGDEQPVLDALRRARKVRNDAGQLVFLIKDIHQLDAGVVAALDLGELRGLGIAPHLGGAVVIAHAAAHADRRAAEGIDKAALGAGGPGRQRGLADLFGEELEGLLGLRDVGVGGNVGALDILLIGRQLRLDQRAEAGRVAGEFAGGIVAVGVAGARMDVGGGDDDLHRVKTCVVPGELCAHGIAQPPADVDQIAGAEDGLVGLGADGEGRHADRFFDIFGDALGELPGERYLLVRRDGLLRPPEFQFGHRKASLFYFCFPRQHRGGAAAGDYSAKSLLMFLSVSRTSCSPPAWPTRPEARNAL